MLHPSGLTTTLRIVALLSALPLLARAPVRVAPQYEDSLRVVIAAAEATSLCINAGGDGLPLLKLVASALDTTRFAKTELQYSAEGYAELGARQTAASFGQNTLPHVIVLCVGDRFIDEMGHTITGYLDWAGQMGIGVVIVGPRGLKQIFMNKDYFPFFSTAIYPQTHFDQPPLFDGRWLNEPGDSLFIRIQPELLLPPTRNYYPNINGILRNTYSYILPVVQPEAPTTILFDDFGGSGRCKARTVSHVLPSQGHYRTLAYQQGFNRSPDTLFARKLDEQGTWLRDSSNNRLFDSTLVASGVVGSENAFHSVTIFEDTITYRTFNAQGRAIDSIKSEKPIFRRVVMLNFNPGYLKSSLVAEQIIYDATMYASAAHLIGRPRLLSTPPEPGAISAANPGRFAPGATTKVRTAGIPSALYSLSGRKIPLPSPHSLQHTLQQLPSGCYIVTDAAGQILDYVSTLR